LHFYGQDLRRSVRPNTRTCIHKHARTHTHIHTHTSSFTEPSTHKIKCKCIIAHSNCQSEHACMHTRP